MACSVYHVTLVSSSQYAVVAVAFQINVQFLLQLITVANWNGTFTDVQTVQ